MATDIIKDKVDAAVARLCADLNAEYITFLDQTTLTQQRLRGGWVARKRIIGMGTYACGIWEKGENIHFICIGSNSAQIFWDYLKEALRLSVDAKLPTIPDKAGIELSAPSLSQKVDASRCILPEFLDLSRKGKAGCKFFLYYAQASSNDDILNIDRYRITAPHAMFHHIPAIRNLNTVLQLQFLGNHSSTTSEEGKPVFVELYRAIRDLANSYGLLGATLGFLNSNDLIWVVDGACMLKSQPNFGGVSQHSNYLIADVLKRFHEHLYLQEPIRPTTFQRETGFISNEQMTLLALSPEAKEAVKKALPYAEDMSLKPATKFEGPEQGFQEFLKSFDRFFKVECECWANTLAVRTFFQEDLVPKTLNQAVEVFRNHHGIHGVKVFLRIWPTPVVHSDDQKLQVYAIAIGTRNAVQNANREEFEAKLVQAAHQATSNPTLDGRSLGRIEFKVTNGQGFKNMNELTEPTQPAMKSSTTPNIRSHEASSTSTKLRPVGDTISRLRHDPKHSDVEYKVGYEDRFRIDWIWLPLELWGGKAVEDEDFIPEHRIRQIRRSDNGAVVWDRSKKIDLT